MSSTDETFLNKINLNNLFLFDSPEIGEYKKASFFFFAICNIFSSIFIYEIINIKHQVSLIILLILSFLVVWTKTF